METRYWEFSLFFPRELLCYFEELKTELKLLFSDKKCCVTTSVFEDKYVFMIALEKETYMQYILQIKQKIADIILIFYKPKTIDSAIKNFDLQRHDNVILLDILSNFDAYADKKFIVQNLSLCDKLHIDSFVNFRLVCLTNRWKEIGHLINENSLFLMDENVKRELMRFLMEGIETNIDFAKLSLVNSKICVDCSCGSFVPKKLYYSLFDYDNMLFALISQNPKQIEVSDYQSFDVNFVQNLSDLFGSKLILKD